MKERVKAAQRDDILLTTLYSDTPPPHQPRAPVNNSVLESSQTDCRHITAKFL